MIARSVVFFGLLTFALLAVPSHDALAQESDSGALRNEISRNFHAAGQAKTDLDVEKNLGGSAQAIREKQSALDRANEALEHSMDKYLEEYGTDADKAAAELFEKEKTAAGLKLDKATHEGNRARVMTKDENEAAGAAYLRDMAAADSRFRSRTRASREKLKGLLRAGQQLPLYIDDVSYTPDTETAANVPDGAGTRTATGTPGAGTAVAAGTSALGTLGTAGNTMTWGGGAMTPVSYMPDMPAMTLAWDSTLLCTFHPTLPYWFPFTPGGPSIAGGTPTTPGSTPGSTPGGSTPGNTPGSTPDNPYKLGLDWGGLRYTPGMGGLGSKLGGDYGDWGKIAYLPQDRPKTTTRKEPKTNQPTTPPPIYVNFKATLAAMQAGQSGSVLPGEQIKIFPESTVDPALPGTNTAKNDIGHDGEPMQGTTGGPDNSVTIPFNWSVGMGLKYGLDRFALGGTYNYELKVDPTRTSVIGNGDKGRIADRAFDGFGIDMVAYRTYWGSQKEAEQLVKDAPEDFQINWCRNKEPFAPRPGQAEVDPSLALPGAILDLDAQTAQPGSRS